MPTRSPAAIPFVLALTAAGMAQEVTADWQKRDLEGKWAVYAADLATHAGDANRPKKWAALLGRLREYELLEAIAIHRGWRDVGAELQRAKAPQFFRVAVWNLDAFDSHNKDNARNALIANAADVLAWFAANPAARRGKAEAFWTKLNADHVASAAAPEQLPPLEPAQILVPMLDAPAKLVDFGDRRRAEPGVRYVHQVLRALDGVLVYGSAAEMLVPKVLGLSRHANATVRAAAFTTLSKLPAELVPWNQLLPIVDDGKESDERRRLATLAMSYAAHPRVFLELLRVAADASHPAAETAQLRIADLAGHGSAELVGLAATEAPAAARTALEATATTLAERTGKQINAPHALRRGVLLAAWLRHTGDARADAVIAALLRDAARIGIGDRQKILTAATTEPEHPVFAGVDAAAMQASVADLFAMLGVAK